MSFDRHLGRFMHDDGLEELRAGCRYFVLNGVTVDLSFATSRWRMAVERCLALIEGSRTYADLRERLYDGDLARAIEEVPVGAGPSTGELRVILRDIIWRRGLRDGRELLDATIARRWLLHRLESPRTHARRARDVDARTQGRSNAA